MTYPFHQCKTSTPVLIAQEDIYLDVKHSLYLVSELKKRKGKELVQITLQLRSQASYILVAFFLLLYFCKVFFIVKGGDI